MIRCDRRRAAWLQSRDYFDPDRISFKTALALCMDRPEATYVNPVKPKPREEAWRKYRETGEKYK